MKKGIINGYGGYSMDILSIGNSFSQDAQRYLHQIAESDGVTIQAFNLNIGGCSLSTHYRNMLSEERKYTLEMNGVDTGFKVSLKEALLNRDWDVVTLQQVSKAAPYYDTYHPYLEKLVETVRLFVPKAKVVLHQTWAYEQHSKMLNELLKYNDYKDMFHDVVASYKKAANDICADYIIPSGEVFDALLENGIEKIHRDTFHASLGLGRYSLGLAWYKFLTGNDISNNPFNNFDEEISPEHISTAKKCVQEVANKYGV